MTSTTMTLAGVPQGFAAPGLATQAVFRRVLEALSRPGRCLALPAGNTAALVPPAPLSWALAAVLLTLLDGETSVWLAPSLDRPDVRAWLAFHTGARLADRAEDASFVAAAAAELDPGLWSRLERGSDERPQRGATLLLDVARLGAGDGLSLSGPGIDGRASIQVDGVSDAVWRAREDDERHYPLGVDLLLCCGDTLAGLPRSTHLRREG